MAHESRVFFFISFAFIHLVIVGSKFIDCLSPGAKLNAKLNVSLNKSAHFLFRLIHNNFFLLLLAVCLFVDFFFIVFHFGEKMWCRMLSFFCVCLLNARAHWFRLLTITKSTAQVGRFEHIRALFYFRCHFSMRVFCGKFIKMIGH